MLDRIYASIWSEYGLLPEQLLWDERESLAHACLDDLNTGSSVVDQIDADRLVMGDETDDGSSVSPVLAAQYPALHAALDETFT